MNNERIRKKEKKVIIIAGIVVFLSVAIFFATAYILFGSAAPETENTGLSWLILTIVCAVITIILISLIVVCVRWQAKAMSELGERLGSAGIRGEMLVEVIESQTVGTMVTDAKTAEIIIVNKMAKDFFEIDPEKTDLNVMDFRSKFSEEGDKFFISCLMELRSGKGEVEFEQALYLKNDVVAYILVNAKRNQLSDGSNVIIYSFMDISERKKLEEDLQIQSETDYLTSICNRRSGEFKTERLLNNGEPGMFCLFDVDKFKSVNDNFGHSVGDNLLIEIARTMVKTFRSSDILIRLGGDEFVIFAAGVKDMEIAKMLINRFFNNIENMVVDGLGEHKVTISLGAVIVDTDKSFAELYNNADSLMYNCKARSGNTFEFFE